MIAARHVEGMDMETAVRLFREARGLGFAARVQQPRNRPAFLTIELAPGFWPTFETEEEWREFRRKQLKTVAP